MPPKSVLNAFSIDVEDYFQVAALAPAAPPESWPKWEYRVERNTECILNLCAERNVRGTFFILGWCAERSPALIRRIAAAGHEIACHGFSHQLIYKQTEAVFREEARRSKHFLEDTIGAAVTGYRAASFSAMSPGATACVTSAAAAAPSSDRARSTRSSSTTATSS